MHDFNLLITFIPSNLEIALSGLRARNVRRERNTDKFLFSKRQAMDICGQESRYLSVEGEG